MKYLLSTILTAVLAMGLISCSGSKPTGAGGPQAQAGAVAKPAKTGNEKIDKFVEDVFAILDQMQEMKEGLAEINVTLDEMNDHPVSPVEWMKEDMIKSLAKAKDGAKQLDPDAIVEALKGKIYGMVESAKQTKVGMDNVIKRAQSLMQILPQLPSETASLGFKAPKALKAIKATGAPLKAIPGEGKAIATEAQTVLDNCNKLLSSIGK